MFTAALVTLSLRTGLTPYIVADQQKTKLVNLEIRIDRMLTGRIGYPTVGFHSNAIKIAKRRIKRAFGIEKF
jgi:hypothetical protein